MEAHFSLIDDSRILVLCRMRMKTTGDHQVLITFAEPAKNLNLYEDRLRKDIRMRGEWKFLVLSVVGQEM